MNETTTCQHDQASRCRCVAEQLLRRAAIIESDYLFAERDEVEILHDGKLYRLGVNTDCDLFIGQLPVAC
jgi:hemin uptake protein HemP